MRVNVLAAAATTARFPLSGCTLPPLIRAAEGFAALFNGFSCTLLQTAVGCSLLMEYASYTAAVTSAGCFSLQYLSHFTDETAASCLPTSIVVVVPAVLFFLFKDSLLATFCCIWPDGLPSSSATWCAAGGRSFWLRQLTLIEQLSSAAILNVCLQLTEIWWLWLIDGAGGAAKMSAVADGWGFRRQMSRILVRLRNATAPRLGDQTSKVPSIEPVKQIFLLKPSLLIICWYVFQKERCTNFNFAGC